MKRFIQLAIIGAFATLALVLFGGQKGEGGAQAQAPLDPRITQIGDRLGIPTSRLELYRATVGQGPCTAQSLACSVTSPGACRIFIPEKAFSSPPLEVNVDVGHEYLHCVYNSLSSQQKARVDAGSEGIYQKYQYLFDQRMQPYYNLRETPGTPEFLNEMHSIVGTELCDNEMPGGTLSWYKQWLPNRDALPCKY